MFVVGWMKPAVRPRFSRLQQWLRWQRKLHPQAVDMGLERVAEVLHRMGLAQPSPAYVTITVGGTNGKGSTVAFLQSILRAAGYRVGAYTSPHLLRYNERVRIDGQNVTDAELCRAFSAVDAARGDVSLSFFEFGTLAALDIFNHSELDIAVLEVGLGGRLDAVNVCDADIAIVTTIALDHMDWLGTDRDSIGYEKAGIFRADRPAVCADPEPPLRLLAHAQQVGARLYRVDHDYGYSRQHKDLPKRWCYWLRCDRTGSADGAGQHNLSGLPLPALVGQHQLSNAAAAITALQLLAERVPVSFTAVCAGLRQARLPGRLQTLRDSDNRLWIFDVSHNSQGAAALADYLKITQPTVQTTTGRTRVLVGMLRDKDTVAYAQRLDAVTDHWYTVSLPGPRGLSARQLATRLGKAGIREQSISVCVSVNNAKTLIDQAARGGDRVVVCGSFNTVTAAVKTFGWVNFAD